KKQPWRSSSRTSTASEPASGPAIAYSPFSRRCRRPDYAEWNWGDPRSARRKRTQMMVAAEPFGIVRRAAKTAKLNDINPQAWLADVLARIADHSASRLPELLPWHWKEMHNRAAAADGGYANWPLNISFSHVEWEASMHRDPKQWA